MFVVGDNIQTILDAFFLGHPVGLLIQRYVNSANDYNSFGPIKAMVESSVC